MPENGFKVNATFSITFYMSIIAHLIHSMLRFPIQVNAIHSCYTTYQDHRDLSAISFTHSNAFDRCALNGGIYLRMRISHSHPHTTPSDARCWSVWEICDWFGIMQATQRKTNTTFNLWPMWTRKSMCIYIIIYSYSISYNHVKFADDQGQVLAKLSTNKHVTDCHVWRQ